jgi:hypothetical protein
MRLIGRLVVSAVVLLAVYFFSYWLLFVQLFPDSDLIAPNILALLTAAGAAFWIWRALGAAEAGILATAAAWAAIVGALGFCGGFFGPMILAPGANQGPLLGLFITGPLGFIGGGLCGLIYAYWHRPERRALS